MSERFKKLYKLPHNLYSLNSPVIISAGSLLKDNESKKVIVQLKFKNVSAQMIKALKVSIQAYDVSGKELESISEYQYLDLAVYNGHEFGSNKAIIMPNEVTRSFSLSEIIVVMKDDSLHSVSMPLEELPDLNTLKSVIKNSDVVEQYILCTNDSAKFIPQEHLGLWSCSCGEWNGDIKCHKCKLYKSKVFDLYDINALEDGAKKRIAAEKAKKEAEQKKKEQEFKERQEHRKIAEAELRKKKKQHRKVFLISVMIISAVMIFFTIFFKVVLPNMKYDKAVSLMNEGKYEEAIIYFEEIDWHRDSEAQIINCQNLFLEKNYSYALEMINEKNYIVAYETLITLGNYNDSSEKANSIFNDYKIQKIKSATVGDTVDFGYYNGSIEWIILDKKGTEILLISKECIDCKSYNEDFEKVSWRHCTLRKWFNYDFYEIAFNKFEKEAINTTLLTNSDNSEYGTSGGSDTEDNIFLLSIDEANKYFASNTERSATATEYARKQGVSISDNGNVTRWWLRSPGSDTYSAAFVYLDGQISSYGSYVAADETGVRPALWIDTSKLNGEFVFSTENDYEFKIIKNSFSQKNIGETVFWGTFQNELIEWLIIDKQNDEYLLIIKEGLNTLNYNDENIDVTWEKCSLRSWLNDNFINDSFNENEKSLIKETIIKTESNFEYGTTGGNDTVDKIFLLSTEETLKYFDSDYSRRCKPTEYIKQFDIETDEMGYSSWLLRSSGYKENYTALVCCDGTIDYFGLPVSYKYTETMVRPAMWVDLSENTFLKNIEQLEENTSPISQNTKSAESEINDSNITFINANVGDIIYFGHCEQDNNFENGTEPISWFVLDKNDDSIMVVSEKILYYLPYNDGKSQRITWEECSLRTWLNSDFYNNAFTETEKKQIKQVVVKNNDNPIYGTEGGNDTNDKIYLLNCEEAEKYTKLRNYSIIEETTFSRADGVERYGYICDNYLYLRSPGSENYTAALIISGEVNYFGQVAGSWELCGICPAMWINIS